MQVKVLQDHGIVRSTKFIDLLTLPLRLTEIGPKVKVSVNGTKALGNKPKKVRIYLVHSKTVETIRYNTGYLMTK
jgi:hypothetical protein